MSRLATVVILVAIGYVIGSMYPGLFSNFVGALKAKASNV